MSTQHFALWLVAACLLVGGDANAQERDRVTVKFFPAPVRLRPYEPMDVQFERSKYAEASATERGSDGFFDEIEQILSSHGITSDWQFVLPDGAFIQINIEIGNRRVELSSAHTLYERGGCFIATERGLVSLDGRDPKQVLAKESEAFRSRRLAFEKILDLVSARVRENLGQ
jgi:hypothetical protein